MEVIEYQGRKISVPESWDDITLGHYETFYAERPTRHRERVAFVAKVCQTEDALLLEWPTEIFDRIVSRLKFVFNENPAAPSPVVEVDGVKYIVPIEDKLSLGAWVDADEAQKAGDGVLTNTLAIVCRPAGEKYDPDKTEERAAMFAALPVSRVLGVLAFFLTLSVALKTRTEVFLRLREMAALLPPSINNSLSLGAGTRLLRIWPILRYSLLTALLRYRLRRFSRSYNISATKR